MSETALKRAEPGMSQMVAASPVFDTAPVDILVVDDLPEKLVVYRSILEDLGQNLVTAQSGEEALKLVLQHEFAVILLDVNMPGMDGFETANLIRKRRRSSHTPIIFLTAFNDEMHAAQGYASGAVDYLPTPVVPEILKAKVRVFIELSQMRRQAASQAEERAKRQAAEQLARRSAFLAELSDLLAKAHGQQEIMEALAAHTVSELSDLSIVWVRGASSGKAVAWHAGKKLGTLALSPESAENWIRQFSKGALGPSGQRQRLNSLSIPLKAKGKSGSENRIMGSTLILPLTVLGKNQGALILSRETGRPSFELAEIVLADDVANRASVALENVLLMEQIREADHRKDEFLGMLAHELRNPLGPIRNAVQLLQFLGPKEPRLLELQSIIDRQVTHMTRLIDDLLDATRLAHGKILLRKEHCDLVTIVQQTVEDYRSTFDASGLKLEAKVPKAPVWVEGDPTRLVQIVGNLLHNAHKFTDPGGRVTVSLTNKGKEATITVRDSGIGLEPQILPFVFDVFRQAEQGLDRSRGGLGLGLALVKGLVELHNGRVAVKSDGIGTGAEFLFVLPTQAGPEKAETPEAGELPAEGAKCRILLIEDNQDAAESARMLLSLEGYEVEMAHNGAQGLDLAHDFRPQVILCDIGLPGMDGYEVARSLRKDPLLASSYVIALTGYGRDEDQRQARQAGFDMHMTKPIDYASLRRALSHLAARDAVPQG